MKGSFFGRKIQEKAQLATFVDAKTIKKNNKQLSTQT